MYLIANSCNVLLEIIRRLNISLLNLWPCIIPLFYNWMSSTFLNSKRDKILIFILQAFLWDTIYLANGFLFTLMNDTRALQRNHWSKTMNDSSKCVCKRCANFHSCFSCFFCFMSYHISRWQRNVVTNWYSFYDAPTSFPCPSLIQQQSN